MSAKTPSRLDPRLQPLIDELTRLLDERGLTFTEAERRAGMSRKYLYKLLRGYQDFKLKHLYDVLEAAEMTPDEFWTRLAARRTTSIASMDIGALTAHIEGIVKKVLDKGDKDNGG